MLRVSRERDLDPREDPAPHMLVPSLSYPPADAVAHESTLLSRVRLRHESALHSRLPRLELELLRERGIDQVSQQMKGST